MKNVLILLAAVAIVLWGCAGSNTANADQKVAGKGDTVRIANDSLEYEVIVTDPGFGSWLASRAYPRNYFSLPTLENKNKLYVAEYNVRASNPQRWGGLYEWTINYDPNVRYGYEVNYLLFNYFQFFQQKYHQNLGLGPIRSR
jgi:hypothetical protein